MEQKMMKKNKKYVIYLKGTKDPRDLLFLIYKDTSPDSISFIFIDELKGTEVEIPIINIEKIREYIPDAKNTHNINWEKLDD